MSKKLVIVESPAKAKTINSYLGSDYVVSSSVGHIRAIEKLPGNNLGIDLNTWEANYEVMPEKRKVVSELRQLAKNAESIYLCSDPDREGEAIAWHIQEALGYNNDPRPERWKRVTFNEITKNAILEAFKHPRQVDTYLVAAQQARQTMDRLVGFKVSNFLTRKVGGRLSAGRVQSVALRLVVEREREINAFIPEKYFDFKIESTIARNASKIVLDVFKHKGKDLSIRDDNDAQRASMELKQASLKIADISTAKSISKPKPPFTTSTLQQAASTHLGFGVKKTMQVAQKLYEKGFITYMRTDSTVLSVDAIEMAEDFIVAQYGKQYLSKDVATATPRKTNPNAQEAHEAIRPTKALTLPEHLPKDEIDEYKLYRLIWGRYLASRMANAEYSGTTVTVEAGDYLAKTRGRVVLFDGWTKVLPQKSDKPEDKALPEIFKEDTLINDNVITELKYTKGPSRYNEASLVKQLEKSGIGRPSTYATIIQTIQDRGYVEIVDKAFHAKHIGEVVADKLIEDIPFMMDYQFTAEVEKTLDAVAKGEHTRNDILSTIWTRLQACLEIADKKLGKDTKRIVNCVPCPACKTPMVLRHSVSGIFLGCQNYKLKENPCKTSLPLKDITVKLPEGGKFCCKQCQGGMKTYMMSFNEVLNVCMRCDHQERFTSDDYTSYWTDGAYQQSCPTCESPMEHRQGRFGYYYQCSNQGCGRRDKSDKSGKLYERKAGLAVHLTELTIGKQQKDKPHYFVLRQNKYGGLYLMSNRFPKMKTMRSIFIDELIQVKDKIPEQYHYFTTAPVKDSQGYRTILAGTGEGMYVVGFDEDKGFPRAERYYYRQETWEQVIKAPKPKN